MNNRDIYLANDVLFAGIEFGALVYIIPAGVAADAHGEHHAHLYLLVLGPSSPR